LEYIGDKWFNARPHPGPLPEERENTFLLHDDMFALDLTRFKGSMGENWGNSLPILPSQNAGRNAPSVFRYPATRHSWPADKDSDKMHPPMKAGYLPRLLVAP
jgi:hypothetical protein